MCNYPFVSNKFESHNFKHIHGTYFQKLFLLTFTIKSELKYLVFCFHFINHTIR